MRDRQLISVGDSGLLILPQVATPMPLGPWRLVQKEVSQDEFLPHVELKVATMGSWKTHDVVQWYMHRPWYLIDVRLKLELYNSKTSWVMEVEPWYSKPLEFEYHGESVQDKTLIGLTQHKFYVHTCEKYDKDMLE
jgi:hypothetical protein